MLMCHKKSAISYMGKPFIQAYSTSQRKEN